MGAAAGVIIKADFHVWRVGGPPQTFFQFLKSNGAF